MMDLVGVHNWKDVAHEAVMTWAGLALWNSFLLALPEPNPGGSRLYLFAFRFAHALGVNIEKLRGSRNGVLQPEK